MSTSPRVSVVIPVYNGAAYLQECLTSIAAQTYTDWTAVVVNNCSTDRTGEVADAFARQEPRVRVAHCTEFLGQQQNYNRAIALADPGAEFIKMVEADNFLLPRCLEQMVAAADRDPKIGLVAGYFLYGSRLGGEGVPYGQVVVPGNDVRRGHLLNMQMYYLGTPTTVLYRAKALAGLSPCFPPGLFYDDTDLCFRILGRWDLGFVHQIIAFVRTDNDGVSSGFLAHDFVPAYRYFLARQYGLELFGTEQAPQVTADLRARYFQKLADGVVGGRSKDFWKFHRGLFAFFGDTFPKRALVLPAARAVLDKMLNPKATLERILARRRS